MSASSAESISRCLSGTSTPTISSPRSNTAKSGACRNRIQSLLRTTRRRGRRLRKRSVLGARGRCRQGRPAGRQNGDVTSSSDASDFSVKLASLAGVTAPGCGWHPHPPSRTAAALAAAVAFRLAASQAPPRPIGKAALSPCPCLGEAQPSRQSSCGASISACAGSPCLAFRQATASGAPFLSGGVSATATAAARRARPPSASSAGACSGRSW